MALETGTYLNDLAVTNPTATDPKSQGDDHLRLIKSTAKATFPGFVGVVIGTGTETGSSNAYAIDLSPAPAAYSALANTVLVFKATHANTGAATLDINSLGAKAVVNVDGTALASGDIPDGGLMAVFYDGTSFLLFSGNDRAYRHGDTYTGSHDFTSAMVTAPTQSAADNSTNVATTAYADAADDLKADLDGATYTGAHDFTGATTTVATAAAETNDETAASTAFVQQQAFQAALPVQSEPSMLYSDGTDASWRSTFVGDSGTGGELGPVPAPAAGDASKVLRGDATWGLAPTAPDVIIQQQLTSGTSGGQIGGSSTQKVAPLNTVVRNVGSLASLSSNEITLAAGTWVLRGRQQFVATGSSSIPSFLQFYNETSEGVIDPPGENATSEYIDGAGVTKTMSVVAVLVAEESTTISMKYWDGGAVNSGRIGVAISTGNPEIYATVEATRVG